MYILKHRPEDFVVEEITHFDLKAKGSFLIVKATKRERNTDEVAQLLAERLWIPRRDVGYAGAKDRNAVTTQHFSIRGVHEEELSNITIPNVTITASGYLDSPLGLGALEGNRFTITIRNLNGDESLSLPRTIPNYFDEQRFGTNNAAIGKAIVKKEWKAAVEEMRASDAPEMRLVDEYIHHHSGDFVGALLTMPRQLLRMYLHAYQSLLWNKALAAYILERIPKTKKILYSVGEFLFPENDVDMDALAIPMPGFSTTTASPIMTRILAEEGVVPRDFVIRQLPNLSLEGAERVAFIEVGEFAVSPFEDDDAFPGKKKVVLSFFLPKGSYATIVVKALLV